MSIFKFKEFEVAQDRCAQKIGTDGVLLGAWASTDKHPHSILDVGTGTGVIALMLAQRFHNAQVEAIELDENAYEQAATNFENSPWGDRLFCFRFLEIAIHFKLSPSRITHVKGTKGNEIKRSLIELRFGPVMQRDELDNSLSRKRNNQSGIKTNADLLTIETSRHQYTDDYIALVKDFYLKM